MARAGDVGAVALESGQLRPVLGDVGQGCGAEGAGGRPGVVDDPVVRGVPGSARDERSDPRVAEGSRRGARGGRVSGPAEVKPVGDGGMVAPMWLFAPYIAAMDGPG